ncbi:hypothetical protein AcW1_007545 [Taiwanofungus camphoratus]|nr:hypothetical protein AcW1_007545 [Antrodia cinnamomea]
MSWFGLPPSQANQQHRDMYCDGAAQDGLSALRFRLSQSEPITFEQQNPIDFSSCAKTAALSLWRPPIVKAPVHLPPSHLHQHPIQTMSAYEVSHAASTPDSALSVRSKPITISLCPKGGSSSSFFDWQSSPTDSSSSSPPSFLPGLSPPTSPPLSPSSSSTSGASSPPASWASIASEAAAGIHYVREAFPSPDAACVPPPFSREPLKVDVGARVVLLEEVGDHALRVRDEGSGAVGLIPVWNVEGALERLARLNMEFNEAATCPTERKYSRRRTGAKAEQLAHSHARCIPFSTRLSFHFESVDYEDDDEDEDEIDGYASSGARRQPTLCTSAQKSVDFMPCERSKVYRYPSEALLRAYYGEGDEEETQDAGGAPEGEIKEEGHNEWWWHGWEEPHEAGDPKTLEF